MKKLINSFFFLSFLFMGLSVNAQKTIDEGYIKMEITDVSSDDEQMAAMLEMMKGSQTEMYFKDGNNLTSMNMMGGMVQMKSLYHSKSERMTMLMDMMGQKMNVESTKEEREKMNADQKEQMEDFKIEYDESDTKEILGYKCIKATVVDPSTKKPTVEMYISREIKASTKALQGMQYFDLDGFPLELVVIQPQMRMTMTTVELKEEIDSSVFDLDTEGYTKMTFSEFTEKMGSMGGGMGF